MASVREELYRKTAELPLTPKILQHLAVRVVCALRTRFWLKKKKKVLFCCSRSYEFSYEFHVVEPGKGIFEPVLLFLM